MDSDEWVEEAAKRGLYNYKSTPDVLPVFIEDKNVKLFTKHHIFTESEINSRYEILLENYTKTLHIEAKTLVDMMYHQFLPAVSKYTDQVVTTAEKKKAFSSSISLKADTALLEKLSAAYDELSDLTEELKSEIAKAEATTDELEAAKFYQATVLDTMGKIRVIADSVEEILPEDVLPYPGYAKMLFYV